MAQNIYQRLLLCDRKAVGCFYNFAE